MLQMGIFSNAIHLQTNFDNELDMNVYPNVLTPPMDSPTSSLMSSDSGCSSPSYTLPSYAYSTHLTTMQNSKPYLRIIEQPVDKFRFRYKSEMSGTHGSLNGKSSDRSRKQTYPSVELINYNREATIRCSLYQYGREDMVHARQLHAHRLVKKQGSEEIDDPHDICVGPEQGYATSFHSMGIIHTAKKFIVSELIRKMTLIKAEEISRLERKFRTLSKKEELEVKALAEKESKCINLNVVCLRFDAFEVINNVYFPICPPVYSNCINNLKSALTGDLKIVRMDHCSSSCRGGREVFLLVEKVTKKNIKVRFFELDDDDNEVWSDYGRFSDLDVHHQYAIVFKTPPYKSADIEHQTKVFIELQRPSDGARSEPKEFSYTPCEMIVGKKRVRYDSSEYNCSYISMDELPVTLNHISPSYNMETETNVYNPVVNSEDLEAALAQNNIDSSEFDKLCNSLIGSGPIKDLYSADPLTTKELKSLGLVMDTPNVYPTTTKNLSAPANRTQIKQEDLINRVKAELTSFMRTRPGNDRIIIMIENLLQGKNYVSKLRDNVLHLLASKIDTEENFATDLINLIKKFKKNALINNFNINGQTPLHLAIGCGNTKYVAKLINAGVDVSLQDLSGNTALHSAVIHKVSDSLLKLLLNGNNSKKCIDTFNSNGQAALHLAVQTNNLSATKLLCQHNANVNAIESKSGHSALHMAVGEQYIDILNYLLENTNVICDNGDFTDSCPLKLAKVLINQDKPVATDVYLILENFMKENGTFHESLLHVESDSEDDIEEISDDMDSVSLIEKYNKINHFTEDCLNSLSNILDKSGMWKNLAELLDYAHLLETVFSSLERPTKGLLNFAVANETTVSQIRDCLVRLGEREAVEIIDNMVEAN